MIPSPSTAAPGLLEGAVARPGRMQAAGIPQQTQAGHATLSPVRFMDLLAGALIAPSSPDAATATGPVQETLKSEVLPAEDGALAEEDGEGPITPKSGFAEPDKSSAPIENGPSQRSDPAGPGLRLNTHAETRSDQTVLGSVDLGRSRPPSGTGELSEIVEGALGTPEAGESGPGLPNLVGTPAPRGNSGVELPTSEVRIPEMKSSDGDEPSPSATRSRTASRIEAGSSEQAGTVQIERTPLRRILMMEPVGAPVRPARGAGPVAPLTGPLKDGPTASPVFRSDTVLLTGPISEALTVSPNVPAAELSGDPAPMRGAGRVLINGSGDQAGPGSDPEVIKISVAPSGSEPTPNLSPSNPYITPLGVAGGSTPDQSSVGAAPAFPETPDAVSRRPEIPVAPEQRGPTRPGPVIDRGAPERDSRLEVDGVRTHPPSPTVAARRDMNLAEPERGGSPAEGAPGLIRVGDRFEVPLVDSNRTGPSEGRPIAGAGPVPVQAPTVSATPQTMSVTRAIEPVVTPSRTADLPPQTTAGRDMGPPVAPQAQTSPVTDAAADLSKAATQGHVLIRTGVPPQVPARPVSDVARGSDPTAVEVDEPQKSLLPGMIREIPAGTVPIVPTGVSPQTAPPVQVTGEMRMQGPVPAPGRSGSPGFGAPVADPLRPGRADQVLISRAEPAAPPGPTQAAATPTGVTPDPVSLSASTLLSDRVALARHVGAQISPAGLTEGRTQITLRPDGLGAVEIELKTDPSGRLSVLLRVENPTVLQALREERNALLMSLEQAGLDLDGHGLSFDSFGESAEHGPERGRGAPASAERGPEPEVAAPKRPRYAPLTGGGRIDILT